MTLITAIPPSDVLAARLRAADRPGEHLWVMAGAWRVSDPQALVTGRTEGLMDGESLISFTGPGCFKCEQPWSRKLSARRCSGSIE